MHNIQPMEDPRETEFRRMALMMSRLVAAMSRTSTCNSGAPPASKCPVFEKPQQSACSGRHITDLVEKMVPRPLPRPVHASGEGRR
jgi:hypothetical protein